MKKQFIGISLVVLVITAMSITSFTPQKDKKNDKEQAQDQGKGNQGKGNQGQGNQGNQGNQGDKNDRGNSGNKGKDDAVGDTDDGKNNKNKDVRVKDNGVYVWDRETFKDRKKYKSQEKVTLCHKINRDGDINKDGNSGVTITVSSNALKAHMNHGDVRGECPTVNDNRYSDIFRRKQVDYFNSLQNGQEEVLYSQSVLDYALARLAESRLQLNQYQSSGMPAADIQRKQATVVELEQNASLLETLLSAAAVLVADKLF